jgi:hypothetical protein
VARVSFIDHSLLLIFLVKERVCVKAIGILEKHGVKEILLKVNIDRLPCLYSIKVLAFVSTNKIKYPIDLLRLMKISRLL